MNKNLLAILSILVLILSPIAHKTLAIPAAPSTSEEEPVSVMGPDDQSSNGSGNGNSTSNPVPPSTSEVNPVPVVGPADQNPNGNGSGNSVNKSSSTSTSDVNPAPAIGPDDQNPNGNGNGNSVNKPSSTSTSDVNPAPAIGPDDQNASGNGNGNSTLKSSSSSTSDVAPAPVIGPAQQEADGVGNENPNPEIPPSGSGGGGGGGGGFVPTNVVPTPPATSPVTPPADQGVLGEQVFSDGTPAQQVLGEQVVTATNVVPTFPKTGFAPEANTSNVLLAYVLAAVSLMALLFVAYSQKKQSLSSK